MSEHTRFSKRSFGAITGEDSSVGRVTVGREELFLICQY